MHKIIVAIICVISIPLFAIGPDGLGAPTPATGVQVIPEGAMLPQFQLVDGIYKKWDETCPDLFPGKILLIPSISENDVVGFSINRNPAVYGDKRAIPGTPFRGWDIITEIDGVPVPERLDRLCDIAKGIGSARVTVLRDDKRVTLNYPE